MKNRLPSLILCAALASAAGFPVTLQGDELPILSPTSMALHRRAEEITTQSEALVVVSRALLRTSEQVSQEIQTLERSAEGRVDTLNREHNQILLQLQELKKEAALLGKAQVELKELSLGQALIRLADTERTTYEIGETWKIEEADEGFWGGVKEVISRSIEVALNPGGSALAGIAKLLPEDAQQALNLILKPTERLMGLGPNLAKDFVEKMTLEAFDLVRHGFWDIVHGRWQNLVTPDLSFVVDSLPIIAPDILSRFIAVLPSGVIDGLWGGLEDPQLTAKDVINPHGYPPSRHPIYYVNGIKTHRDEAERAAGLLSDRLMAPVTLLYSSTDGLDSDLGLAAYDRLWPYQIGANLAYQKDHTVSRLAWLILRGPDSKMTIVTQSRGCIQARNALWTVFLMGQGDQIKSNVAWIATGITLTEREILFKPEHFTALAHDGDLVSGGSRLQFQIPGAGSNDDKGHDFAGYVSQIIRDMTMEY